jgi:hypothetical protein
LQARVILPSTSQDPKTGARGIKFSQRFARGARLQRLSYLLCQGFGEKKPEKLLGRDGII